MGRSVSPKQKRRDSTSSSSSSSSNSSSDPEAPAKKPRTDSPSVESKKRASPPSKFKDERRRSRSPDRRDIRRRDERDERRRNRSREDRTGQGDRRRDDRSRRSPPRRRESPPRRDGRDFSPRRRRDDSPRRDTMDRDRGRSDRRDEERRKRDESNERHERNTRGDKFGLTIKDDVKKEVKDEPESPKESQLIKARDARRGEDEGGRREQKWGTRQMWEADEKKKKDKEEAATKEKEKVNMASSGLLAQDTNMFNGVVIKYSQPPDAKKPNIRWRLYPFKDDETLPVMYIHRQSAYLIGRDRKIADMPVDHPSCSKQHAVIQYRSVSFEKPDGSKARRIRPYIIDLGSANGTYLNGQRVDPQRYIELKEKDVLKFGFSTREYVILTENALEHEGKEEESSSSSDDSDDDEE